MGGNCIADIKPKAGVFHEAEYSSPSLNKWKVTEQSELFLDFLQEHLGFSVWSDFPEMFLQSLGLQENQIKYCFISNKEG